MTELLWNAVSASPKLGPVPVSYVGPDLESTKASCLGCPMFEAGQPGASACYAWSSVVCAAAVRVFKHARDRTLARALERRSPRALVARLGALGDPARVPRDALLREIATLRETSLGVLGYTHHWREAENLELQDHLCASTESVDGAIRAWDADWCTTVVVPADTPAQFVLEVRASLFAPPGSLRGRVCPAQLSDKVTCNDCRRCDPTHPGWDKAWDLIGFRAHGNALRLGRKLPTAEVTAA